MIAPLDVLDALDSAANDYHNDNCPALAADMREARAAVAELVDKSGESWKLLHNALSAGQLDARYAWIAADLKAALAKFGGAA